MPTAARKSSLTSAFGANEYEMLGVMACLKRLYPRKPGIRPKIVGDAPSPNVGRFVWVTHRPSERNVRTMNGSLVTFWSDTLGVRLNRPRENPGKENCGVQSSEVVNRRAKMRSVTLNGALTSVILTRSGKSWKSSE